MGFQHRRTEPRMFTWRSQCPPEPERIWQTSTAL